MYSLRASAFLWSGSVIYKQSPRQVSPIIVIRLITDDCLAYWEIEPHYEGLANIPTRPYRLKQMDNSLGNVLQTF